MPLLMGPFLQTTESVHQLRQSFRQPDFCLKWALLGMAAIYGAYAFFVGDDPHQQSRMMREVVIWPVVLGLGALYVYGLFQLKAVFTQPEAPRGKQPGWRSWVWVALIVCSAMCALMTPFHSTDVFGYINRGWQQAGYHLNPYVTTVVMMPDWRCDPMFTNHWIHNPSPYGFVFLHIARWLCLPFKGLYLPTLGVFKWAMAAVHIAITLLLWWGLQPRASATADEAHKIRQWQWLAVVGYGLNPLLLLHHIGNGHNDLWMALLLLIAAVIVVRYPVGWRWVMVLPLLTAATLVKYAALVTIPITLWWLLVRKYWSVLLWGGVLSVLVVVISGAQYLPDWQHFIWSKIGDNAQVAHASVPALVWSAYKELSEVIVALMPYREWVRRLIKYSFMGGYVLSYAWLCWQVWRNTPEKETLDKPLNRPDIELVGLWVLTMALALGVFNLKFYPWYLGMYLPLAFLIPQSSRYSWLKPVLVAVTVGQLLSFTVIGQARFLDTLLMLVFPVVLALWVKLVRDRLSALFA